MKKVFNLMISLLAVIMVASCSEKLPETDGCGDLELVITSSIGDFTLNTLRITDGNDFLLQSEEAANITAGGTPFSFHIPAGTYSGIVISIVANDCCTGTFSPKDEASILINDGGLTRLTLDVTSLKDNSVAEESLLPEGRMFNLALKAMVRQSPDSLYCSYSQPDSIIKSITFVNESASTDGIRVDNFAGAPAYASYDKASGAITISTSAKMFHMNEYASFMFDHLEMLESIDFGNMTAPAIYKSERMFSYCRKLKALDLSWIEDTSDNTSMDNMFSYCESLEELDVTRLKTGNVQHMRSVFNHCISLKSIDVSGFDTSKALVMSYMFQYTNSLERLDISSFTVNHLEGSKLNYFFYNMPNLKELRIGDDFYSSDGSLPSNFFTTTSLAYGNRIGSSNAGLTIYTSQASADWLAKTNLRWINSGYNIKKPIPVTFIDSKTGEKINVTWAKN